MEMFLSGQVSSLREAAFIVGEELYKDRDNHLGKFPGNSQQTISERLYVRVRELEKQEP